MTWNPRKTVRTAGLALLWLMPGWLGAQQAVDATDVTADEIEALYAIIGDSIDLQAKIVDVGGTNVGVGALQRGATKQEGDEVRGLVHGDVTEVYYVLSGSGLLVTGGTVELGTELPPDNGAVRELVGPSHLATSTGGRERMISVGDIVVIPAGTFHGFREIEDEIRYLSIRVDPDQVLPEGYVHPELEDGEDNGSASGLGFFSPAQADRGRESYAATCKECHALSEFRGEDFEWNWRRQTAWELFKSISSTMPESDPGGLGDAVYADIVAYLLSVNEYEAGSEELAPNEQALAAIPLGEGVDKSRSVHQPPSKE